MNEAAAGCNEEPARARNCSCQQLSKVLDVRCTADGARSNPEAVFLADLAPGEGCLRFGDAALCEHAIDRVVLAIHVGEVDSLGRWGRWGRWGRGGRGRGGAYQSRDAA